MKFTFLLPLLISGNLDITSGFNGPIPRVMSQPIGLEKTINDHQLASIVDFENADDIRHHRFHSSPDRSLDIVGISPERFENFREQYKGDMTIGGQRFLHGSQMVSKKTNCGWGWADSKFMMIGYLSPLILEPYWTWSIPGAIYESLFVSTLVTLPLHGFYLVWVLSKLMMDNIEISTTSNWIAGQLLREKYEGKVKMVFVPECYFDDVVASVYEKINRTVRATK